MIPETWLPTCTVINGFSVPVAETVATRSPRVTLAVFQAGDDVVLLSGKQQVSRAGSGKQQRQPEHPLAVGVCLCVSHETVPVQSGVSDAVTNPIAPGLPIFTTCGRMRG